MESAAIKDLETFVITELETSGISDLETFVIRALIACHEGSTFVRLVGVGDNGLWIK